MLLYEYSYKIVQLEKASREKSMKSGGSIRAVVNLSCTRGCLWTVSTSLWTPMGALSCATFGRATRTFGSPKVGKGLAKRRESAASVNNKHR